MVLFSLPLSSCLDQESPLWQINWTSTFELFYAQALLSRPKTPMCLWILSYILPEYRLLLNKMVVSFRKKRNYIADTEKLRVTKAIVTSNNPKWKCHMIHQQINIIWMSVFYVMQTSSVWNIDLYQWMTYVHFVYLM